MFNVILFGGTSEGRVLADFLSEHTISSLVCVATEYGQSLLTPGSTVTVRAGRLNDSEILNLLHSENPYLVIDATHPYADLVTKNIQKACEEAHIRYLRLHRDSVAIEGGRVFATLHDAIQWINTQAGVVFSSLGAKTARELCQISHYAERVYLRVLPFPAGIQSCVDLGYPMAHIIGMQGPFSQQLNEAMFLETDASILLTKESGASGGFTEKLSAAKNCGMQVAVIARPEDVAGMTLDEIKQEVLNAIRLSTK